MDSIPSVTLLLPTATTSSRSVAAPAVFSPSLPIPNSFRQQPSTSLPSKAVNGVSHVTLLEDTMLKKLNDDLKKLSEDQGLDETLLGNISIAPEGMGLGKNV